MENLNENRRRRVIVEFYKSQMHFEKLFTLNLFPNENIKENYLKYC